MTKIKKLIKKINSEIDGAKDYAESYIECKTKGNSTWATRYKEMATDELKHSTYIHEKAVAEIAELERVYTPPQEMLDKWEHEHKYYVEQVAWIKQMLAM